MGWWADEGGEGEEVVRRQAIAWKVLTTADLFQAEGLLTHCLKTFKLSLTLHTTIECLVCAHLHGPLQICTLAIDYVGWHLHDIVHMYDV